MIMFLLLAMGATGTTNTCCSEGSCDDQPLKVCVADFDRFCSTYWDMQCIQEAKIVCGLQCIGPLLVTFLGGTPDATSRSVAKVAFDQYATDHTIDLVPTGISEPLFQQYQRAFSDGVRLFIGPLSTAQLDEIFENSDPDILAQSVFLSVKTTATTYLDKPNVFGMKPENHLFAEAICAAMADDEVSLIVPVVTRGKFYQELYTMIREKCTRLNVMIGDAIDSTGSSYVSEFAAQFENASSVGGAGKVGVLILVNPEEITPLLATSGASGPDVNWYGADNLAFNLHKNMFQGGEVPLFRIVDAFELARDLPSAVREIVGSLISQLPNVDFLTQNEVRLYDLANFVFRVGHEVAVTGQGGLLDAVKDLSGKFIGAMGVIRGRPSFAVIDATYMADTQQVRWYPRARVAINTEVSDEEPAVAVQREVLQTISQDTVEGLAGCESATVSSSDLLFQEYRASLLTEANFSMGMSTAFRMESVCSGTARVLTCLSTPDNFHKRSCVLGEAGPGRAVGATSTVLCDSDSCQGAIVPLATLLNGGQDCGNGCLSTPGKCDWCGTGYCCSATETRNGCVPGMSTTSNHVCVAAPTTRRRVFIATLGHLNHGKTTLTAAMTYVLSKRFGGKLYSVDEINNAPMEWLARMSRVEYNTENRQYTHVDSPEHKDYVKSMLSGFVFNDVTEMIVKPLGMMDGAILVVSATDGMNWETRAHVELASQIGVPYMIVFINKCDVETDEYWLEILEMEVRELLSENGFPGDDIPVVRGSALKALEGDLQWEYGIVELARQLDVYIPEPERVIDQPSRLVITFEAVVYVLSAEEGGRHTPFSKGYSPDFKFHSAKVAGSIKFSDGFEMAEPGDGPIKMTVTLVSPVAMEEGMVFEIVEGTNVEIITASGVVARINT